MTARTALLYPSGGGPVAQVSSGAWVGSTSTSFTAASAAFLGKVGSVRRFIVHAVLLDTGVPTGSGTEFRRLGQVAVAWILGSDDGRCCTGPKGRRRR